MFRRPKPGEDEEDILRMQEEFLREKDRNRNHQPAAQVVNLRRTEPTKRPTTSEQVTRKPSKYAQSKGLKNHPEKIPETEPTASTSIVGDILEKNTHSSCDYTGKELSEPEDDKVYYPKVMPSLLGNIIEKNVDEPVDLSFPMPSEGFPVATKRSLTIKPVKRKLPAQKLKESELMDIDETAHCSSQQSLENKPKNLPKKSCILSSKDAADIHEENVNILSKMSEKEILEGQQKLLSNLDPKLVAFLKQKRKETADDNQQKDIEIKEQSKRVTFDPKIMEEAMDISDTVTEIIPDYILCENDVLSHPQINKWLHFDSLERDKLEWMKGLEESKKVKADEPYEARFNFKGYLLPYSMEYSEKTKALYHHGEEPHRPGYSLTELFELSRSAVIQQRVMALNTLAGVLDYYSAGTYKDIIEIPLTKIFFIIRIAMDENKVIGLEPALKAMRNLLYNRIDEACLDALIGFEEGTQQPCLENDKSEIEELESNESELKDYHLAEIDIIAAALRTDILQRLYYILEFVKPSFNCVQYVLQILTRLARDSVETAMKIVKMEHLMRCIVKYFVPISSINFAFDSQILYNGKPVLAAVKLLRVLSLQSREISEILISKYDILRPISEYISSGVDGTYGLRVQIEAFCILSNLLSFNLGIEDATSLNPIIVTTLYKHVQATDIFITSSAISATHAAVVLQFVNKLLNCNTIDLGPFKCQIYPLLKQGVQKWLMQLCRSEEYTCAHLRLLCAALDCCKTVLVSEQLPINFLNESLNTLSASRGFGEIMKHLIPCSNLLSGIDNGNLHITKNLMNLGGSVVDSSQKVLPLLNVNSPLPFLASLYHILIYINQPELSRSFLENTSYYIKKLSEEVPSLCDNWFTRIESEFVFYVVKLSNLSGIPECNKDLLYAVANKLCYILRIDKREELEYLFNNILFNKDWFTADRLLNLVSLSDADGFSKALSSIEDIKLCYHKVININYMNTGPNVVLRKWKEPILPRDWIYLPILTLYSKSQETNTAVKVVGEHATKVAAQMQAVKELVISCSLEWILFNELCFPDLLSDISITDRFCRIMCVYLCDNSLFLDSKINLLLRKCIQMLFKKKAELDFDKKLVGLHNFQDFYTQFLEQFQSVSYGDHTFAACVLVPLAQRHNVKWRKLLWSEYAGCLRVLDCPEEMLCYELRDYFFPEETDESLIKSYFQALSGNLTRPNTIAYKIAEHHVRAFKQRQAL